MLSRSCFQDQGQQPRRFPLGASSPFPFRQGFVLQLSPVMGSEPEKALELFEALCWALVAGGWGGQARSN